MMYAIDLPDPVPWSGMYDLAAVRDLDRIGLMPMKAISATELDPPAVRTPEYLPAVRVQETAINEFGHGAARLE